jgi:hypothetical protein
MTEWEYRVHTLAAIGGDEDSSRRLTNIAQPLMHERGHADGWEIFAVEQAEQGARLYMKRPKRDAS